MTSAADDAFWSWFRENERRFRALTMPAGARLLDEFEERLHRAAPRLGFLVSEQPDEQGRFELVLTTHGDRRLAPAVRRLAAAAPELPGWVVVPFQPPQGFDFTHHVWDRDVDLDPRAMRFDPTARRSDPTALGLRVVARPEGQFSLDDLRVAVHRILATALGDEAYARIEHIEVAFADPMPDDLIPLPDLPRYMAWHARRKGGGGP